MAFTKQNRLNNRRIQGGVGTASFGEHVFGSAGSQSSIVGSSNLIATNSGDTYSGNADMYVDKMVVDGIVGGKRKIGGRGILTDIAIPAALLYANNTIGKTKSRKSKKSKKSRKSMKSRKSRKNKMLSSRKFK